jgi:hypothetical protein
MADQIRRVRVKFTDSIAGLRDPTPAVLSAKYSKLAADMKAERNGKNPMWSEMQIQDAAEKTRQADAAVLRTGFAKDWSFKPGDEAMVNQAVAEEWEAAGVCTVLGGEKKAA